MEWERGRQKETLFSLTTAPLYTLWNYSSQPLDDSWAFPYFFHHSKALMKNLAYKVCRKYRQSDIEAPISHPIGVPHCWAHISAGDSLRYRSLGWSRLRLLSSLFVLFCFYFSSLPLCNSLNPISAPFSGWTQEKSDQRKGHNLPLLMCLYHGMRALCVSGTHI